METVMNNLEKLLSKMERSEKALDIKIEKLGEAQQEIATCVERLLLEIEEIKTLKTALKQEVVNAQKGSIKMMVSQMIPPLVAGFNEGSGNQAQQLKKGVEQAVFRATALIDEKKWEITWRKIWVTAVFCCGSVLTALSVFYFFPQHVNYGITTSIAESIVFGEALIENSEKLTEDQRQFFVKKAAEKLRKKYF